MHAGSFFVSYKYVNTFNFRAIFSFSNKYTHPQKSILSEKYNNFFWCINYFYYFCHREQKLIN